MQPKRRKPTHPGEILSEEFLKPLGISPKDFAKQIGGNWTEARVLAVIDTKEDISEKMAEELAAFFATTAHFWIHLQRFYNEYEAIQKRSEKGSLKPWKKAESY